MALNLSDPSVIGRLLLIVLLVLSAILYAFRKKIGADIELLRKRKVGETFVEGETAGPLVSLINGAQTVLRFVVEYLRAFKGMMFKQRKKKPPVQPAPSS